MSPSPLVAIQWSWHPTKPPASSCRKSCLESESQNADFVARFRYWQLETMREQPSLEWLCPNPSAVSSPGCWHVTVVTSEAGLGPSSDPGARPLGADTELLKDEMDWYERIAVYCVLTSILQTRHYLSLTQTPETPLMPSRRFHWFTF